MTSSNLIPSHRPPSPNTMAWDIRAVSVFWGYSPVHSLMLCHSALLQFIHWIYPNLRVYCFVDLSDIFSRWNISYLRTRAKSTLFTAMRLPEQNQPNRRHFVNMWRINTWMPIIFSLSCVTQLKIIEANVRIALVQTVLRIQLSQELG